MLTNEKRRAIAEDFRHTYINVTGGDKLTHHSAVLDEIYSIVLSKDCEDEHAIGLFNRLADLIDPTCEACKDTLFYPETELAPEKEVAVYRCSSCGGIVACYEYNPETDEPVYCESCGCRIKGIGEPWDE